MQVVGVARLATTADGKTILCGIVGGYFGVEVAKWTLDVRVKTGDTFALPLALAMAVGRWGCFFNGCCYGVVTTLRARRGLSFIQVRCQWWPG